MRFAICAVDRDQAVFDAFLAAGWQPVKLFSVPVDNQFDHNRVIIGRAAQYAMPVQLSPMSERDLAELAQLGCDVLVCASYDWRIPDWTPHLSYAINFHPSPLPIGRGPNPAIRAILEGRREWAASCHKITEAYDSGDILAQEPIAMDEDECYESLDLKIHRAQGRLAERVARDFTALWDGAQPQQGGEYWSRPSREDCTLDLTRPVAEVLRKVRAFGLLETLVELNDATLFVRRAVGWQEAHGHPPGSLVYSQGRTLLLAAQDGFIGLVEWSPIPRSASSQIGR
jgi:methionyl-tRNA formyltransferase